MGVDREGLKQILFHTSYKKTGLLWAHPNGHSNGNWMDLCSRQKQNGLFWRDSFTCVRRIGFLFPNVSLGWMVWIKYLLFVSFCFVILSCSALLRHDIIIFNGFSSRKMVVIHVWVPWPPTRFIPTPNLIHLLPLHPNPSMTLTPHCLVELLFPLALTDVESSQTAWVYSAQLVSRVEMFMSGDAAQINSSR